MVKPSLAVYSQELANEMLSKSAKKWQKEQIIKQQEKLLIDE